MKKKKRKKKEISGEMKQFPWGSTARKNIGIWDWNSDSYTENPFCYRIEEILKCSLNRELGKKNGYPEEGGRLGTRGQ